jgi:hypothetical protein
MARKAATTDIGGTTGAMLENERVEILRNLLAEQGFLSILDLMAATGVSAATGVA